MSRFSKAEAEARGWQIYHEKEEDLVSEADTQGRFQREPAQYEAERYYNGKAIRESADSIGLLLERIAAFERHVDSLPESQFGTPVEAHKPHEFVDDEGNLTELQPESVILPADDGVVKVTEAEYAARDRGDVIVSRDEDGKPKQFFFGGSSEEISDLEDELTVRDSNVEDLRVQEPYHETEQVLFDPPPVDAPGAATGGQVILRKGETVSDVTERRQEDKAAEEDRRVGLTDARGSGLVPPREGAEILAGADAGLGTRGDLGSEIPREASLDNFPEGVEPTSEAVEEAISGDEPVDTESAGFKEITDTNVAEPRPLEESDVDALREEPVEPDATEPAKALAAEKGVDLSEVEGTGKNGRITKPDVEAALEE